MMQHKAVWLSSCGLCKSFPRKSGATSLQERPSPMAQPVKTILHVFCFFILDSEITTQNNGARPQPTLIWTHLLHCVQLLLGTLVRFVANMWCSYSKRAKRTNEKSVSELWGGLLDPGWSLNRGPSCEVIQKEGRILHACGRHSVGGAQQGWGPTY